MKKIKPLALLLLLVFVSNCKNNNNSNHIEKQEISIAKKQEIVKYYLAKYFNKPVAFEEIIFLNDLHNQVKVITNKNQNAFTTFRFSNALDFYNKNHKE